MTNNNQSFGISPGIAAPAQFKVSVASRLGKARKKNHSGINDWYFFDSIYLGIDGVTLRLEDGRHVLAKGLEVEFE